ncbi:hypothetical protein ACLOJK_019553 [Asimina triloba]
MSTKFGASPEHRNSVLHLPQQATGGPITGGQPIGRSRLTKIMATTNSLDLHHRQSSSAIIKPLEQWQPQRPAKRHLLRRAEQKWQAASTATFSPARSTANQADDQDLEIGYGRPSPAAGDLQIQAVVSDQRPTCMKSDSNNEPGSNGRSDPVSSLPTMKPISPDSSKQIQRTSLCLATSSENSGPHQQSRQSRQPTTATATCNPPVQHANSARSPWHTHPIRGSKSPTQSRPDGPHEKSNRSKDQSQNPLRQQAKPSMTI